MNKRWQYLATLICLVLGFVLRDVTRDYSAKAAAPESNEKTAGRFQISAHGTGSSYGCYMIDTATGDMWHSTNSSPGFNKVSGGPAFVH